MEGFIVENISNLYRIKVNDKIYEASARGRFKKDDITPVVGDIVEIEVLEEERRKGVASKLMEYLIKNNLSITLEVKNTNVSAINLYKKYGFVEVAKRRGYYNGVDGILMEKRSDK